MYMTNSVTFGGTSDRVALDVWLQCTAVLLFSRYISTFMTTLLPSNKKMVLKKKKVSACGVVFAVGRV